MAWPQWHGHIGGRGHNGVAELAWFLYDMMVAMAALVPLALVTLGNAGCISVRSGIYVSLHNDGKSGQEQRGVSLVGGRLLCLLLRCCRRRKHGRSTVEVL